MKGLRVTKIVNKIKFGGVWGELEAKYWFQIQLLTKYMRQTLAFMWNREIRKFQFLFFSSFLLVSRKSLFWDEDWTLGYNSREFWDFPDLSKFPKILSLKLFGNSYILSLLVIIALRFTCGESKIWEDIKMSQNIMKMTVDKKIKN